MKQYKLFNEDVEQEGSYSKKIDAPIYEPKNKKPHVLELVDDLKTKRIIRQINDSKIPQDEKDFLIQAAYRHLVFNYEKIADYYAHSNKEVQELMERSALVIIDFEKAIQLGYVKLSEEIRKLYLEENNDV